MPSKRRTSTRAVTEKTIMDRIQLALGSRPGVRLFRNNVGQLDDRRGIPLKYGLLPGSADLIGWAHGRFLSVEVKTERGRESEAQKTWAAMVKLGGGIHLLARSVLEAELGLEHALKVPATAAPRSTT